MGNDALKENMLLLERNSRENIEYYDALQKFFEQDTSNTLLKLRSFALYTPRQVISDFLARYFLFSQVVEIPGSIVECGVFNGQGMMSFAQFSAILEPNNLTRTIYGLDTFEGFPAVDAKDMGGAADRIKVGGYSVEGAYERLTAAIHLFDRNRFIGHVPKVSLIRGDIANTAPQLIEDNPQLVISLLYLDADLYEPTKVTLDVLMPRVPKGGIVAFDELNMKAYPGETRALLDSLSLSSIALKRVPFCSRISYFVR